MLSLGVSLSNWTSNPDEASFAKYQKCDSLVANIIVQKTRNLYRTGLTASGREFTQPVDHSFAQPCTTALVGYSRYCMCRCLNTNTGSKCTSN